MCVYDLHREHDEILSEDIAYTQKTKTRRSLRRTLLAYALPYERI